MESTNCNYLKISVQCHFNMFIMNLHYPSRKICVQKTTKKKQSHFKILFLSSPWNSNIYLMVAFHLIKRGKNHFKIINWPHYSVFFSVANESRRKYFFFLHFVHILHLKTLFILKEFHLKLLKLSDDFHFKWSHLFH